MFVSLNTFTIDQLDGVKLATNILFVVATVGVWLGVYLENDKFSERTKARGWKLLVYSLGVETLLTVLILQIDAEVGARQKLEIAELTKGTETLRKQNLSLQIELERIKIPRLISPDQTKRIISRVRVSSPSWIPFDLAIIQDPEAIGFANQMAAVLGAAGWIRSRCESSPVVLQVPGKPDACIVTFVGIELQISELRRKDWGAYIVALRDALTSEGFTVKAEATWDPKVNHSAIHVRIGRKP